MFNFPQSQNNQLNFDQLKITKMTNGFRYI